MTGCPGYLCVTVTEWPTGIRLIRHDVLISCPSQFELNFYVARVEKGQRLRDSENEDGTSSTFTDDDEKAEDNREDYIYEFLLDDAKDVHRFLLLHPLALASITPSPSSRTTDDGRSAMKNLESEPSLTSIDDVHVRTAFIVVVMVMTIVSLRLFSQTSVCSSCWFVPFPVALLSRSQCNKRFRKSSALSQQPASSTYGQSQTLPAETGHRQAPPPPPPTVAFVAKKPFRFRSSSCVGRRFLLTVYVIWKLVCSVGVTLTVLSTVARIAVRMHFYDVIDTAAAAHDRDSSRCSAQRSIADRLNRKIGSNAADEVRSNMFDISLSESYAFLMR